MGRYTIPNITAQNEVSGSIPLGSQSGMAIGIQTPSTNGAAADVELQGSIDDSVFTTVATVDPADNVTVNTHLIGASKAGAVPLNTRFFKFLRVKRLDNNPSQACTVLVSVADK